MTKPLSPEEKDARSIERLTVDNSRLRALNRKILRYGGFAFDAIIEDFKEILEKEKNSHPFVLIPTQIEKHEVTSNTCVNKGHSEVACLAFSDLHLSEQVKNADVNGINTYNTMICANRLYDLVQAAKKIIKLHQSMYKIDYIWIPMLGDMISGSIHPELELTNELTDTVAAILAARLIQMFLLELKTLNIPIKIDCIVGNHTRTLAKMPVKAQTQLSYDWVIYEMLANYFEDDPQITFTIHTGQIGTVNIYNWKYVIEHGIDVKNGKEEEFEDRIRALFDDPTFREATGIEGASFDQIIIGNLHKTKILERTIVNGSLVGQSELGQGWRLKPVRAQQVLFGVSRKHVRTWSYALDVTHVIDETTRNPMSKYAKEFMKRNKR